MTDDDALDVLASCQDDNCQRLFQYLVDDGVSIDDLGYEDVFYPLRDHHDDGLAIEVTRRGETSRYVWGAGDLVYDVETEARTFETAVDPFPISRTIRHDPLADFDVTIVEDSQEVVDDAA